jgi:hypothetical protein
MSFIHFKNRLQLINKESSQRINQTEGVSSSNITDNNSNLIFNNNSSSFNKINKSKKHIVINSQNNNQKKKPNLIKNVHHRPKIAVSCDNFRYQPLSSFEQKLSKQLGRISNKYTEIKNRKFFNKSNINTELFWQNFPDYEIYRQLKVLETRKEIPYGFPKPKLKPLINNKKDKLGKLAKNLYEADQAERFKELIYKYKINREKSNF